MIKIPLNYGKFALIDDEDYNRVSRKTWTYTPSKSGYTGYAQHTKKLPVINHVICLGMHRLVMGLPIGDDREVDHRDGNGLNNQKHNLRICTRRQNMMNKRVSKNNMSGYKGVSFTRGKRMWQVRIKTDEVNEYIGSWFCVISAAKAYDEAAIKHFGEFARLNFPDEKVNCTLPNRSPA